MMGFIKRSVLASKQKTIKRLYPGVNMNLNKEMPMSAIGSMPGLAKRVHEVNRLEPAIAALSDEQLRAKSDVFRAHIAESPFDRSGYPRSAGNAVLHHHPGRER